MNKWIIYIIHYYILILNTAHGKPTQRHTEIISIAAHAANSTQRIRPCQHKVKPRDGKSRTHQYAKTALSSYRGNIDSKRGFASSESAH